jgi:hypothetical protein
MFWLIIVGMGVVLSAHMAWEDRDGGPTVYSCVTACACGFALAAILTGVGLSA